MPGARGVPGEASVSRLSTMSLLQSSRETPTVCQSQTVCLHLAQFYCDFAYAALDDWSEYGERRRPAVQAPGNWVTIGTGRFERHDEGVVGRRGWGWYKRRPLFSSSFCATYP